MAADFTECELRIEGMKDKAAKNDCLAALAKLKAKIIANAKGENAKRRAAQPQGAMRDAIRTNAKTLAAFEQALREPASTEGKMLSLLGGTSLTDNLLAMYKNSIEMGASHRPLSPGEAVAVHCYMGNYYGDMNAYNFGTLDPTTPPEQVARAKGLNEICEASLAKLPTYPETAWPTYRYERKWSDTLLTQKYVAGNSFVIPSLWSTGAGAGVDLPKGGSSNVRFHFTIFGKSGKDVAAMAVFIGEGGAAGGKKTRPGQGSGEVLFPKGTKFHVNSRNGPVAMGNLQNYELTLDEM